MNFVPGNLFYPIFTAAATREKINADV